MKIPRFIFLEGNTQNSGVKLLKFSRGKTYVFLRICGNGAYIKGFHAKYFRSLRETEGSKLITYLPLLPYCIATILFTNCCFFYIRFPDGSEFIICKHLVNIK